jgi:CubicO group peptidase (beta-lactamase class C family)
MGHPYPAEQPLLVKGCLPTTLAPLPAYTRVLTTYCTARSRQGRANSGLSSRPCEQRKNAPTFCLATGSVLGGIFKLAHRRRVPLGEFCWVGAFGTAFWVDPKERLIAVLMAQLAPTQTRHYRSPRQWCVHRACQALPHNRSRCSASGARASIR